MSDVHDGVPPKVTRWKGGNSTYEWPICPGCGGRMHRKRTRCTKCRHAAERQARRASFVAGLVLAVCLLPAIAGADLVADVHAQYLAAMQQRDAGDPVGAFFDMTRLGFATAPAAVDDPQMHHELALVARLISDLAFYFGRDWAADEFTGAWPPCLRFQLGYLFAMEGLTQAVLSGSRAYPWTTLQGIVSRYRSRLRREHCAVPGPQRLWAEGDPA